MSYPLIFEKNRPGTPGYSFPEKKTLTEKYSPEACLPENLLREEPAGLPEAAEIDVVRHYTSLSRRNFGVDLGFYPLGSCTMKYNPRVNEQAALLPGFSRLHPLQPEETIPGLLEAMGVLLESLSEITGMDRGTLSPFAGAQGEFTGMKIFRAYFKNRGEEKRTRLLVPDSSHGTNPASAHIAGFEVVELPSDARGFVDVDEVEKYCDDRLAGIMLTNPNTLGLFEKDIVKISELIHGAGGLLYYDGANLNAIMGKAKPGLMGFDCVHLNLHKTFSTPHGGGGPGAGPVLVKKILSDFLPGPVLVNDTGKWRFDHDRPLSIGRVAGFYGNVGIYLRALSYILVNGSDGLTHVSEMAVLNANYLKERLKPLFDLPFPGLCKHELVLSARRLKEEYGVSALDIAKGLIDRGIHPPTVYFPLIVSEAMMIEPTETENRETLDNFVEVMRVLREQAQAEPENLHLAPQTTPVGRVDEVLAARKPRVNYFQDTAKPQTP